MKTPRFMKMLLACTAIVLTLSQCSSDDPSSAKKPTDIYVAGSYNTLTAPQYNWVPAYWNNGELVQLSEENGEAKAIAVVDGDVYVIGKLDSNDKQLVLWTNGTKTNFTDGDEYERVYAMKVFGNDWYAVGTAYVDGIGERAAYWKNGVLHYIPTSRQSNGFDLTVDGDDVYVVGSEIHLDGYNVAKVWKNDDGDVLSTGDINAAAYSVAVDNGDVYVSGHDNYITKLWKNGELSAINTDNINGTGYGTMQVVNGDVYMSGYQNTGNGSEAFIWKNGVAMDNLILPEGATDTYGYNLVAIGSDIYMLGEGNSLGSNNWSTLVWKNGELLDSYKGDRLSSAYSINIVAPK